MKTNWQDPGSGEILSTYISGLQEAIGKIEDTLKPSITSVTNVTLEEILIYEGDSYRIYQSPGKRNWLADPAPVIKVNGVVRGSGYAIEYGGGGVVFSPPLSEGDMVTADFAYVVGGSEELDEVSQALDAHKAAAAPHSGHETPAGAQAKAEAAAGAVQAELDAHKADYANLVDRVNNLNTNDIQARKEILDIKLKLDEQQVIEFLNKTGIGFFDLFEDSENIDIANTTAVVDTAVADVIFNGQQTLKMKPQTFDNFNTLELALYYKGELKTLEMENNVSNSAQIDMMISPGSIAVGEKYYYNGEVYTVIGVQEV
jgi:hypothetical protein